MSKTSLQKSMLPLVVIGFNDHSADFDGEATPHKFLAIGLLLKETPEGYLLGHWIKVNHREHENDLGDVTTFIAKVVGMQIKTITHLKVK
jgi:hypothetical protein